MYMEFILYNNGFVISLCLLVRVNFPTQMRHKRICVRMCVYDTLYAVDESTYIFCIHSNTVLYILLYSVFEADIIPAGTLFFKMWDD